MKLTELVETIINKEKKHPYVIAFEGMIGSGKSYEANLLKEQLCGKAQQISTDLFVRVPRSEWSKRLEAHDVDLHAWYDLQKIKQALESVKRKQSFIVSGLYNLSNGQFNDELHVDATDCDYLVLEGLLSCHEYLDEFGITDEFREMLTLKKRWINVKSNFLITGERFLLNEIEEIEIDLKDNANTKVGHKKDETVIMLEQKLNFPLDPKKMSVKKYYNYINYFSKQD